VMNFFRRIVSMLSKAVIGRSDSKVSDELVPYK
jgi:hypothetical protein